jgi:hypothetical protein
MAEFKMKKNDINLFLSKSEISERFQNDIEIAIQILKNAGCSKVYIIDSLNEQNPRVDSDINLAVRGCPSDQFVNLRVRLMREMRHSVTLFDLDHDKNFVEKIREFSLHIL